MLAATLAAAVDPAAPASIVYGTGRGFGPSPVYSVTVHADGSGLFIGVANTAVIGERRFRVSADQYRGFAAALAPLAHAGCESYITHAGPVSIHWRGADGSMLHRRMFAPCLDRRNPPLGEQLRRAPQLLPIGDFIGRRR